MGRGRSWTAATPADEEAIHTSSRRSSSSKEIRSAAGAAQSIYVVVTIFDTCSAYSLYKVDYPYSCSPKQRLQRLAILETTGGKTFVSVQTQHRKWIVGVGGDYVQRCHTVVFDTKTKEVIHGPDLLSAKDCPVLVSVEDKIYALSSCPRVQGKLDFEPWFEVLDLSQAKIVDGRLEECSWKELPNPPCFPCQITVMELRYPPLVIVQSYLVVGSYILVSLRSNHGTYAFNTISGKWQQVDSKNLPFTGCANPHGTGGVYLGKPRQENPASRQENPPVISAYCIKLRPARPSNNVAGMSSTTSEKDNNPAMKLSVTEFPIKSETCKVVTAIYFCSLDKGSFCSLNWKSRKCIRYFGDDMPSDDDIIVHLPKKAYITLETYQMENSVLQETEQTLPVTTHKIAISKQPVQAFKIRTKSGGFNYPAFVTVFNTYEPAAVGDGLQFE